MPLASTEFEDARRQLDRVLASPGFLRNERMSRFLRFLAERHLEGNDNHLKESVIAVEVFGRKSDHDPSHDSIVRTEAGRLRARLAEYYVAEGKDDPVVIDLPKGGYTPVFRYREPEQLAPPPPRNTRRRIWPIAAAAGLTVAAGALIWLQVRHRSEPITIAVLPLENLSHDPASDYFADGLTDELIRNLSLIEGLSTRSRTSSFAFKGKPRNVREVGKELETDYVVEGSVLRIGKQLRVDAQLVRVRDDFPLWSGRYDRALTDIFAVQDEISRGIVNSLRLKLGRGRRRYETSAEAYDLYLQARASGIQQGLSGEIQSVSRFEAAIAKDPSFAPAYAGLAAAHATRSAIEEFNTADELAEMQAAAEKALELDPLLAEAHGALGMVYARQAQWQRSEKSFRRALELDPNDSVIYGNFALDLLLPLGRIQEAVRQLRIAVKNDPFALRLRFILANALMAAGRFDEAAGHCMALPADYPGRSEWLGRARLGQGRIQEAIQILEDTLKHRAKTDLSIRGYLGYAYGRAGRRDEAERLAEGAEPYSQALVFAGMGDKKHTLDVLERMANVGPVRLGRILNYPEFALVRGDPRVKALRREVGLPEEGAAAHFTQITRLVSRTGVPPAVSDIWFPPAPALAGIWILTCQTPEIAPVAGKTETNVAPFAVTTGAEVTPEPLRNNVTAEPAEAGFRQVLTEPSGLRASGNSPLTDAELSLVQAASAGKGVAVLRNAVGLLATIGSVSESEIFDSAEANSDVRLCLAGNSKGRLEVDLFPADVKQRARDAIDSRR